MDIGLADQGRPHLAYPGDIRLTLSVEDVWYVHRAQHRQYTRSTLAKLWSIANKGVIVALSWLVLS